MGLMTTWTYGDTIVLDRVVIDQVVKDVLILMDSERS